MLFRLLVAIATIFKYKLIISHIYFCMKTLKENFTLSNSIGYMVNIVANKMKLELEYSFEKENYNITALQWMVLGIIYENDGILQNELVKKSKKDKTNIARIINKLEKKSFIRKIKDDIDKRNFRLFITDDGKRVREELVPLAMGVLEKSTTNISEDEQEICLKVLTKIYSNLD